MLVAAHQIAGAKPGVTFLEDIVQDLFFGVGSLGITLEIAAGAPKRVEGFMTASDRPGLGIEPNFAVLGDPVLTIG